MKNPTIYELDSFYKFKELLNQNSRFDLDVQQKLGGRFSMAVLFSQNIVASRNELQNILDLLRHFGVGEPCCKFVQDLIDGLTRQIPR